MTRGQTLMYFLIAAVIIALVAWLWHDSPTAHAQEDDTSTGGMFTPDDTLAAIDLVAEETGQSAARLRRIVSCETGGLFDPYAHGKQGELGAVQLHPRGLLPAFYAAGYVDPFSPYQSVRFLAQRLEADGGAAWTCKG